MTLVLDVLTVVLVVSGCIFFTVGTIGVVRLPDTLSRMHALTKADNLGLGSLALGLALQTSSIASAALLILIWILALGAAATISALLSAERGRR